MNKFVFGALAVTAASSLGFASSTDGDWSTLDKEIDSLSTSLTSPTAPGAQISGFLRIWGGYADKDIFPLIAAQSGNDLGFNVDDARLVLQGDVGAGYGYYIGLDINGGLAENVISAVAGNPNSGAGVSLIDAYGTFKLGDQFMGTFGRFRPGFLGSGNLNENTLLFRYRTYNGSVASLRQDGLMVSGNFDQFGLWASAMNGIDGVEDNLFLAVRGAFNAMGKGTGNQEGAYGVPDEPAMTIGAGWFNDNGVSNVPGFSGSDGTGFGGDIVFTKGPFYIQGEVAYYDTGVFFVGNNQANGSSTPWDVTASWMLKPNEWEIAGRYEDWDNINNTEHFALGVNWYINGMNAKWTAEWDYFNSDNNASDGNAFLVGLTLGI
jgi:hypothetical protein